MARINVLTKQVAELIAAGEVVERPASVIKELVENSIDAGATAITVEIQNGGSVYMRVTDNGCGIHREDVPLAFVSHATSKVVTEQDLEHICTFGFRGEALASICAVSRTEMLTRLCDEELGTRCVVHAGEIVELDEVGCPKGTTIIVRDLFYNVPARMKFLKKDITESGAVYGIIERVAMSHPEIAVKFIKDGKLALQTSGNGDILAVLRSLYGREFSEQLIPVSYEFDFIKVSGYISKPTASRPNRNMQHFFVNGRMVKSPTAMKAVEEAYKGAIMVGKHPSCVLDISLSPNLVDVNVHPAKTQVRFVNDKSVFESVYYACKTAIKSGDTVSTYKRYETYEQPRRNVGSYFESVFKPDEPSPQMSGQTTLEQVVLEQKPKEAERATPPVASQKPVAPIVPKPEPQMPTFTLTSERTAYKAQEEPAAEAPVIAEKTEIIEVIEQIIDPCDEPAPDNAQSAPAEEIADAPAPVAISYRVIGEAFKTYIIVELEKELLLIDKHAAHERMIYEKLKDNITTPEGQLLLRPITVLLSREEYIAAIENTQAFASMGFEIEDYGDGTVLVRQVPMILQHEDIAASVTEIADYLSKNKRAIETEKMDWILHNVACRAAIKSGDKTSDYEMNIFVGELLRRDDIRYCPHGRPICISLPKREIDKDFGRV
ncbi:MAG: DNA mismatch repair endonuclease MutL [Clostridia bacterium]|nr:DNA mismatch repair endonuclease MutL [Clostridia bacterium]